MPPQIKQQITLMVRGGQSKNDNAQIDNLFRLTSPDWVSSKESEELRETIINNEWSSSGLQSTTGRAIQSGSTQVYISMVDTLSLFIWANCKLRPNMVFCALGMRQ